MQIDQFTSRDLDSAREMILAADHVGLPISKIFGDVMQPALVELGMRWERGELLVAQEKEISELARDIVAQLASRHVHPHPSGPPLVAASVEGEHHDLGLRMIICMLRATGSMVHFLGANVWPRFILEAVQMHQLRAMLLSAKLDGSLPATRDTIEALNTGALSRSAVDIIVGGAIVSANEDQLRAWSATPVRSHDLTEICETVWEIVNRSRERTDDAEATARRTGH